MHKRQKWIADWREQNALSAQQVPAALRLAGIPPPSHEWRAWIDRLLLWLGVAALLSGLIFFVAANWSGMGRFFKFALAESVIIVSLAAYVWGARFRYGNAALLVASLALGALLALIGQTYQTGADTYQLFLVWALLILPWVLAARLPALWVLWLAILHVAYVFFVNTFEARRSFFPVNENIFIGAILLDGLALTAWEWFSTQGRAWMRGRWVPRLLALTMSAAITALMVYFILDNSQHSQDKRYLLYFFAYFLILAGMYGVYRRKIPDIFMPASGALSLIVVATTGLGRILLGGRHSDALFAFFLLGLFSLLATAGAAWWLRQIAREMKEYRAEDSP
ncbi:MAG: DUF2157 domain-containing protein [Burkholderiales bacterium]|jgi:uncharacterized membrane protein|nr:DUF2157 domain-containing protein [Burkholderiales bacterium]